MIRTTRGRYTLLFWGTTAVLLLLWHGLTGLRLVDPFVLPSPGVLLQEFGTLPGPGNPAAPGVIQKAGDFLLAEGIIKSKVDGRAAVDASYVAAYLKARR